ncbi:MAG: UbiA-like polyprenyltransferase [Chloroherpetonaceae bacterium]|nr:putative 4-hydroxybenzoate polyprenyltransferase [Chthonomonadaceae bacterium]MDW8208170.1 UbiA-like polyprenyltransferase [Chloroherpetonaceae bacterium]
MRAFWRQMRLILDMIKFEHTIFALPFALIGAILAAGRNWPSARELGWILTAMVGARSAAMSFNRLVDAPFDAQNPRTARRHIPAGLLSRTHVWTFFIASTALFFLAAWQLSPLCLWLAPIALLVICGYSYTKRFTPLCHLFLGFAIGIAPIGAWIAIRGTLDPVPLLLGAAVMLWIGGFDIIYALQDYEFDLRSPLHSLPKRLGKAGALRVSRAMHAMMLLLLVAAGVLQGLHALYFLGVAVVAALIAYEQSLVHPDDLSRVDMAFFTLNGWVSVSLLAFVLLDRVVLH